MRPTLTLLALLLGSTTTAAIEPVDGGAPNSGISTDIQAQTVNQVIDKAMHWLDGHPASVRDNELMEVVEEVMFFYALHSTPGYEAERPYFLTEITRRHRAIEAYLAETGDMQHHLEGDWAALTYPPLVHILSEVGLETDAYRVLIDELISLKRHLAPPRNAMRLRIAIYLARRYTDQPLQVIGKSFNRYHATALHAIGTVEKGIKSNGPLHKHVEYLSHRLESGKF